MDDETTRILKAIKVSDDKGVRMLTKHFVRQHGDTAWDMVRTAKKLPDSYTAKKAFLEGMIVGFYSMAMIALGTSAADEESIKEEKIGQS